MSPKGELVHEKAMPGAPCCKQEWRFVSVTGVIVSYEGTMFYNLNGASRHRTTSSFIKLEDNQHTTHQINNKGRLLAAYKLFNEVDFKQEASPKARLESPLSFQDGVVLAQCTYLFINRRCQLSFSRWIQLFKHCSTFHSFYNQQDYSALWREEKQEDTRENGL